MEGYLDKYNREHAKDPDFVIEGVKLDITLQIMDILKDRGMTKKNLADKLGVSKPYITRLLDGDSNFTLMTLVKIGIALDMNLNLLLLEKKYTSEKLHAIINHSNKQNVGSDTMLVAENTVAYKRKK